ncbi:hypothetical protein BRARA_I05447 [Brassica rapa]|uniref:Bifunctional inhibitor/plant lipid transfer protein/seed storage helical domain-containing protein n=1 Tax=Brassica campestris TaxID=3711 RepID=A0A397YE88_BRACM|nr:hypothetical protein BRARA_I05447 [Brassica rapa]
MDPKSFLISALIFSLLSNSPILMSLAQINTPCSPTMLSSATAGCMSFLMGGASSPTSDCCRALKTLTGTSMDCLCLIVTANVPLDLPINRTLAISLPRACGVPVQCKGPASFGPATSPTSSMDPDGMPDDTDVSGPRNGGDPREPPKTSASSPSSSLSLKLSLLLFAVGTHYS